MITKRSATKLLRSITARVLGWVALIASGGVTMSCPAYGVFEPTFEPEVEIADFSYTPAGQVRPGEQLRFVVTLDRPTPEYPYAVSVKIGAMSQWTPGLNTFYLPYGIRDDGVTPDTVAGDGIYTGVMTVPSDLAPQTGLPVTALYGFDEFSGPLLDILPGETE